MKIYTLDDQNAGDILAGVEAHIRDGGIAIIPTDTVYGIVGDARDEKTIETVFRIKRRPEEKAFPVFIGSIKDARRWAYIADAKAEFLEHVWPGQVTVIFQKKEALPPILTGGKETIGMRIPDSPFLARLLSFFDFPILQTSANISNEPPAKTRDEVLHYFRDEPAIGICVDGGDLPGVPSTVIDFTSDHPLLVRSGLVTKIQLDRLLGL